MINSKPLIYSIIAGLLSALLAALALTRPGLLTMLIYVAAVPVFFAGLAWGTVAGIISALVAAVSTGLAGGIPVAVIVGITTVGPAAYASYMARLSRTDSDGNQVWFPISEILFRLSLIIAAAFIALGLWFGYDVDQVASQFEHFMLQMLNSQKGAAADFNTDMVRNNARLYASLLPLIVPPFSLAILVWNMSLAERMVRKRIGMARPKDNIAANSGLPRSALVLFAAALVVALLVPALQSLAYVVVGIFAMAIAMVGLAVMHYYTWGLRGRSQILFLAYVLLFVTSIPIILFLVLGLVELLMLLRARDPNRMPPTNNTPNIKS